MLSARTFDEVNNMNQTYRAIDFETYFGEMELSEEEKNKRISLAERLEEDSIPHERIEALLEEASRDELYRHSYEVICDVLQSIEIDKENEYSFLKYYGEIGLNQEDKVRVNRGISFAQEYVQSGVDAIPEDARYILNDEFFV